MTWRKYAEEKGRYERKDDWLKPPRNNTKPRGKNAEVTVPSFIKIKKCDGFTTQQSALI